MVLSDKSNQVIEGLFKQELHKLEKLEIDNAQELRYLWQTGIRLHKTFAPLIGFVLRAVLHFFPGLLRKNMTIHNNKD